MLGEERRRASCGWISGSRAHGDKTWKTHGHSSAKIIFFIRAFHGTGARNLRLFTVRVVERIFCAVCLMTILTMQPPHPIVR